MTPIKLTQQMLGHLGLSESELIQIRDLVDAQADIVVRGFMERHGDQYERLRNGEDGKGSVHGVQKDGVVSDTAQKEQGTAD